MPQMMPHSWLVILFSSAFLFLTINSCWSIFFFLPFFPTEKDSYLPAKKNFFK